MGLKLTINGGINGYNLELTIEVVKSHEMWLGKDIDILQELQEEVPFLGAYRHLSWKRQVLVGTTMLQPAGSNKT